MGFFGFLVIHRSVAVVVIVVVVAIVDVVAKRNEGK